MHILHLYSNKVLFLSRTNSHKLYFCIDHDDMIFAMNYHAIVLHYNEYGNAIYKQHLINRSILILNTDICLMQT